METANVVFVPGLALALGFPHHSLEAIALVLAMTATAGFLVVGAVYWRAVDRRLRLGDDSATGWALAVADRVEKPLLVATGLAIVATVIALVTYGFTRSVIAAAGLSLLTTLEYINYYHRQLQHFDNVADLKRLLTGRGLRIAHLARELARWRGQQGAR